MSKLLEEHDCSGAVAAGTQSHADTITQIHSDSQAKGCAGAKVRGQLLERVQNETLGVCSLFSQHGPMSLSHLSSVFLCHPPGEHLAAITDHTGTDSLHESEKYPCDESDGPCSCFCSSIVDLVSPDGRHKGQVATDVTNGRHARSRRQITGDCTGLPSKANRHPVGRLQVPTKVGRPCLHQTADPKLKPNSR